MIIGIAGKRRSGKDTISDYLIKEYDFIKYGFADPIKDIGKIIFGFTEEQLYGNKKDIIDLRWGIKPRDFFQKFGTDYGQNIFPEHFPEIFKGGNKRGLWVQIFKNWYLNKIVEDPFIKVIINDVRFLHEYDVIKSLGGYIINVERNGVERNSVERNSVERNSVERNDSHISENELDNINFDGSIQNNDSIEDLYRKIKEIIN
jgi:dephospho-CoA kinase